MARLEWLRTLVDTAGLRCPLVGRKCPGHRKGAAGCAFWLDEVVSNEAGQTEPMDGCAVLFLYSSQHEVVVESARTQASIQSLAGRVHEAGRALGLAVTAHRMAIQGGAG